MPFIFRCPHCRFFQLREDSDRGARVTCLCCKQEVVVDPSGSGEWHRAPKPSPAPQSAQPDMPSIKAEQRQRVIYCPKCRAPLALPPDRKDRVQCSRCQHVFSV